MSIKVYMRPYFSGPDKGEGGIRRWVDRQRDDLPGLGIDIVNTEEEADVVVVHAGDILNTSKPLVTHNHGLYNTAGQTWGRWEWQMNRNVIENLRRANIVTAPSEWVAGQLARGMSIQARVLYAGVDGKEWTPGKNEGYILWNKTRVDAVCDPAPLNRLAMMNPGRKFISTFSDPLPNIHRVGRQPYVVAKEVIRNAAVYLATPRETFGIGTLEAMACGVPVLGWRWGGQVDIVKHGITGYLAELDDYEDLHYGLQAVLQRRDEMGQAAREDVLDRFHWEDAMQQCVSMYEEARSLAIDRPKVSVIVTVYDLERYLPECLDSLLAQDFTDWECLIVDDHSPGNVKEIAADYCKRDRRFRYLQTPRNLYLAGARNYAMAQARGRYLLPLDADDMLGDKGIGVLAQFLDQQPGFAIAYGAMKVIEEDKKDFVSGWPGDFRWELQLAQRNQLPYGSMYRREVWERTGGYRERCVTSEDNDFWCRVTSFGYRAKRVSNYPTLIYRNRPESMSRQHEWPDCTIWYPWARDRALTPFGSVGKPQNDMSWPVKTYTEPLVSVIIPVGPGHSNIVRDACDSVLAQSDDRWELLVVNDSGEKLELDGFPWAKILETPKPGSGPAIARNIGVKASQGKFFVLLDADDYLMPDYLSHCLQAQAEHGGYVYTDWFEIGETESFRKETPEFSIMDLLQKGLPWAITSLFPRSAWEAVGGFDADAGGWEDWDFYFALATKAICGTRVPAPLWCYRYYSGERRDKGYLDKKANAEKMRKKWQEYTKNGGKKLMGCSGCGGGGGGRINKLSPAAKAIQAQNQAKAEAAHSGMILMEYVGSSVGTQTIRGPKSRQVYRFGGNGSHRRNFVWANDVPDLSQLPYLQLVNEPEAPPLALIAEKPPQVRQSKARIKTEAVTDAVANAR